METKRKKDFDAVEWVRGIREENFRRLGHLPMREYLRKLSEEGDESELGKKLRNRKPLDKVKTR